VGSHDGLDAYAAPACDAATLRAFVAVARSGGVSRAAEALDLSQPGVSMRLAALERAGGTRLFRRQARGMSLTPEGARLLPGAEAALAALHALDEAAGLPAGGASQLRVGAGDALGREVLPQALKVVAAELPDLDLRVVEGPGARLLDALRRGDIDVALVVRDDATGGSDVEVEDLLESRVELLVPERPARFGRPGAPVPLERLRNERVVALQPGSAFRRHVESALAQRGVTLRATVEVGNLSLVRRFVAAGLGVAPVPAVAFGGAPRMPGVEARPLSAMPPVRYAAVRRSGVPVADVVARLLDALRVRTRAPRDPRTR
jgi:DNA-binding transcriptional LysR family regulator